MNSYVTGVTSQKSHASLSVANNIQKKEKPQAKSDSQLPNQNLTLFLNCYINDINYACFLSSLYYKITWLCVCGWWWVSVCVTHCD